VKIVCLSDTHLQHDFDVPEGDVLLHAGDATFQGDVGELNRFFNWFNALPHKTKIYVPGNHDWLFQTNPSLARSLNTEPSTKILIDQECILQENEGAKSFKVYGSPWQPEFGGWAFNLSRAGLDLYDKWNQIPDDVDILITHGPPQKILDLAYDREVGCYDLARRVETLKNLKLHVFGHIHYSYGTAIKGNTRFVNAAIVDESYLATNPPIVINL
jgi:predicted phosphohydrolase